MASVADPETLLRPAREPAFAQERSRRSYLALIDAATALFSAHGYDAVGTPEIAAEAGVSVGTFYRYFDDKHALYLEVARRTLRLAYTETIAGLTPARFVGRGRRETIAETIALLFQHVLARPQLMRSFRELALRDPAMAELDQALQQLSLARLTALIEAIIPRRVIPDPAATAWVIYGGVMFAAYGLAEHVGAAPVDAERATRALTDMVERALFPDAA